MGQPLRELRFRDRSHAGQVLAARMPSLRHHAPIVVGIAGGGVPVAAEIARALGANLDVLVVQPVRSPSEPHVVVGVLAEGGALTLDRGTTDLTDEEIDHATLRARRELRRRAEVFRAGRPLPDLGGRTVVLVDDGILTGRTMAAALGVLARFRPARVIAAAPVAATMVAHRLRREADELVTVSTVGDLRAVADVYEDFHPFAEAEVLGELARGRAAVQADVEIVVAEVDIDAEGAACVGTLTLPRDARAVIVVCAGDARRSAARATAFELLAADLGSLIIDAPASPGAYVAGVDCVRRWPAAAGLAVGLLGNDAAVVSAAAAERPGVHITEPMR